MDVGRLGKYRVGKRMRVSFVQPQSGDSSGCLRRQFFPSFFDIQRSYFSVSATWASGNIRFAPSLHSILILWIFVSASPFSSSSLQAANTTANATGTNLGHTAFMIFHERFNKASTPQYCIRFGTNFWTRRSPDQFICLGPAGRLFPVCGLFPA